MWHAWCNDEQVRVDKLNLNNLSLIHYFGIHPEMCGTIIVVPSRATCLNMFRGVCKWLYNTQFYLHPCKTALGCCWCRWQDHLFHNHILWNLPLRVEWERMWWRRLLRISLPWPRHTLDLQASLLLMRLLLLLLPSPFLLLLLLLLLLLQHFHLLLSCHSHSKCVLEHSIGVYLST